MELIFRGLYNPQLLQTEIRFCSRKWVLTTIVPTKLTFINLNLKE